MVAVPTHFFKVVLAERATATPGEGSGTEAIMGAFVLPNALLQADMPLTAFSVPLEALEEAAGVSCWPVAVMPVPSICALPGHDFCKFVFDAKSYFRGQIVTSIPGKILLPGPVTVFLPCDYVAVGMHDFQ